MQTRNQQWSQQINHLLLLLIMPPVCDVLVALAVYVRRHNDSNQ